MKSVKDIPKTKSEDKAMMGIYKSLNLNWKELAECSGRKECKVWHPKPGHFRKFNRSCNPRESPTAPPQDTDVTYVPFKLWGKL